MELDNLCVLAGFNMNQMYIKSAENQVQSLITLMEPALCEIKYN